MVAHHLLHLRRATEQQRWHAQYDAQALSRIEARQQSLPQSQVLATWVDRHLIHRRRLQVDQVLGAIDRRQSGE
jgi:hypothetical protein